MRQTKAGICLVILAAAAMLFCSCSPKKVTFYKDGMSITLTDEFTEGKYYDMTAYYDSENATVSAFKEEFSLLEEKGESSDMSLHEYAELLMKSAEIDAEIENKDGLTYFIYEKTIDFELYKIKYVYFSVIYKSSDAFWLFQFACEKDLYEDCCKEFVKWAQSVKFR